MAEVGVDRRRVVLALGDVEEGARRFPGAVLRDEHRGSEQPSRARILEDEHVAARERVADLAAEAPRGGVDDPRERAVVVRQVHRVEPGGEPLQLLEVASLRVAEEEHRGLAWRDAPPDGHSAGRLCTAFAQPYMVANAAFRRTSASVEGTVAQWRCSPRAASTCVSAASRRSPT